MANIVHDSTEEENVRKFKRAISKSSNGYTTVGYSHLFRSSGLKKKHFIGFQSMPKTIDNNLTQTDERPVKKPTAFSNNKLQFYVQCVCV